jgi:hypothetical protein
MGVGLVYFVFLPSIPTTLLGGKVCRHLRHSNVPCGWTPDCWHRFAATDVHPTCGGTDWHGVWSVSERSWRRPARPAFSDKRRKPTAVLPAALSRVLLRRRSRWAAVLGQLFDRLGWPALCLGGRSFPGAGKRPHVEVENVTIGSTFPKSGTLLSSRFYSAGREAGSTWKCIRSDIFLPSRRN